MISEVIPAFTVELASEFFGVGNIAPEDIIFIATPMVAYKHQKIYSRAIGKLRKSKGFAGAMLRHLNLMHNSYYNATDIAIAHGVWVMMGMPSDVYPSSAEFVLKVRYGFDPQKIADDAQMLRDYASYVGRPLASLLHTNTYTGKCEIADFLRKDLIGHALVLYLVSQAAMIADGTADVDHLIRSATLINSLVFYQHR